ncbi:MAG: extracellular solute-binding protein [bacterium]|nr:extracellular solute-binding protein [bacterium]
MTKFQIIAIIVFLGGILAGLISLATYKGSSTADEFPQITIWGTLPANVFDNYIEEVNTSLKIQLKITYIERSEDTFNSDLVSALARGQSPDAVIIPTDLIYDQKDKYAVIPFTSYTKRDFKNNFIEESEILLDTNGIIAFPFAVDPLVMYWNRAIFTSAGIASYPKTWDDLTSNITKLTKKDDNSSIFRSAVAFGEWRNVDNVKEIFSTLLMQAGDPITYRTQTGMQSSLGKIATGGNSNATLDALTFFTDFSNTAKDLYSWNRSLPSSKSSFVSGKLATYFGFSSEYTDIINKNPNLNFDIAPMPQLGGEYPRTTYGKMYVMAFPKISPNLTSAYQIATTFLDPDLVKVWTKTTYLPPVRRDVIAEGSADSYLSIFYDSALISKAWIDPNPAESNRIFQNMVETYTSGKSSASSLIDRTNLEFNKLFTNENN